MIENNIMFSFLFTALFFSFNKVSPAQDSSIPISDPLLSIDEFLEIITLNEKVPVGALEFLSGFGVVGLYVSVVLVVGRIVRALVDSISHNIIYEDMVMIGLEVEKKGYGCV